MTSEQSQIVESQIPYARSLAWRMCRRFGYKIEREELEGVAFLALAECILRYNPELGALKTYVYRRVTGAMIDFAREEDPLTRGQRKVVGRHHQVMQQFADEEDAAGEKISKLPSRSPSPEFAAMVDQAWQALCRYETRPRDRLVMMSRFGECKGPAEIAREIGVHQTRVSQIVSQETQKLRAYMGAT